MIQLHNDKAQQTYREMAISITVLSVHEKLKLGLKVKTPNKKHGMLRDTHTHTIGFCFD